MCWWHDVSWQDLTYFTPPVFYPDLIDKTRAPTYRIQKIPDDPDTVLLVFSAGPPYEDIAFRVVNKQWEMGHKRGFRNSFDRGVLQ